MAVKKSRNRVREHIDCSGASKTVQSEAEKTNINKIMAKYQQTGHLPQVTAQALYGQVPGAEDFRDAMQIVADAKSKFDALPAEIRKKFGHDPQKLLDMMDDPETKKADLVEMGLAEYTQEESDAIRQEQFAQFEAEKAAAETTNSEVTTEPAQ